MAILLRFLVSWVILNLYTQISRKRAPLPPFFSLDLGFSQHSESDMWISEKRIYYEKQVFFAKKRFYSLTKSRRRPFSIIFDEKTSTAPLLFYCRFVFLIKFYVTYIFYRKSYIVWNLPPWNDARVSNVLKVVCLHPAKELEVNIQLSTFNIRVQTAYSSLCFEML